MPRELSEEEIMESDVDPMEAIREIRRAEGVAEEDLPERGAEGHATGILEEAEPEADQEEMDNLQDDDEQEQTDAKQEEVQAGEEETAEDSDGDNEGDERDSDTDSEESGEETAEEGANLLKFRANGQDFEFTPEEVNEQFETVFGQAMDYTKKMQNIAPYRKMISALETEGVTQDSLNMAIDALKGDKQAIRKLMEINDIDGYDLTGDDDGEKTYSPKSYGKDEIELEIEEVTRKIANDEEYKITTNVIGEQWDADSRREMAQNPRMIQGLHNDIKSGLYDKVSPVAMKMKVLDGNTKSDIEYYMLAGQKLNDENQQRANADKVDDLNAETQGEVDKFGKASSEANRKRKAASTGTRNDRKGVIDYLDDNDDDFDEWYKSVTAPM